MLRIIKILFSLLIIYGCIFIGSKIFFDFPIELSLAKRLMLLDHTILLTGRFEEIGRGIMFLPICAGIAASFWLILNIKDEKKVYVVVSIFISLIILPFFISGIARAVAACPTEKIELISSSSNYGYFNENKRTVYPIKYEGCDPLYARVNENDTNMDYAYKNLQKQARSLGADGLLIGDTLSPRAKYDYRGNQIGKEWAIAGYPFMHKDTNTAVPRLMKALKSWDKDTRRHAIEALALIKDPRSIRPLMAIVEKGPREGDYDYFNALEALSEMHYEAIYPRVLNLMEGKPGWSSFAVSMLENFPEKPETLQALKDITETNKERYIRDKAKKALKRIQALGEGK